MSRSGKQCPAYHNVGSEKPHIHNVLQRGKAESGSRGIYDAVNGLPEIAAPVDADPNCDEFEELFDGADQQEAHLCRADEVFLWQDGPCDILQNKCGNGTGAPPEKHTTNIRKRPLILAGLPVEIPQPKQPGHEPENRKNRHQIITSELTLLALDRITQSYRRAKASTAANKPAGQCFRRAGQIKSDLSHAIGPEFCRSEERANGRQSRVPRGTVPQCKWHNTCERLH